MTEREDVPIPGARDVRATLDRANPTARADAVVVACPPHPRHGGSRTDQRLRAVAEDLTDRGIDCLRFDYGPWAEGTGERADAHAALDWAGERYARVGLFGYSFGGAAAVLVAAERDDLAAVAALAPASGHEDGADAVAAVPAVDAPAQVVYGARDDTADWEGVVAAARGAGWIVAELPGDHFFVGQQAKVADAVVGFLAPRLS
ncbi:MAG: dienelactone hydrolase family protein [Haloferacaceae archaeon]